ncbi:hypothetical protein Tco_0753844 [Tanacetum coccineum]
MSLGRLCIATKPKRVIDEEVFVVFNGDKFVIHVRELSNWSGKIEDDIDSEDGICENEQVESHSDFEDSTKQKMKNSDVMGETYDILDTEKENNVMKDEEIPQKQEHSDCNSTSSYDRDLCFKHNINFLGVQESKIARLEFFRLRSMWGNYSFDYACSMEEASYSRDYGRWHVGFQYDLSEAESNELERRVNSGEIKRVVWDSRSDKALGSDGFCFQFLKRY